MLRRGCGMREEEGGWGGMVSWDEIVDDDNEIVGG